MTILLAPSAAPNSVTITEVTSSSIIVQWGAVPCIHRNGDITGYIVSQTPSVSGGSVTETTISNLTPSTTYNIRGAAVNDAGTGPFSNSISIMTLGIMDHNIIMQYLYMDCDTYHLLLVEAPVLTAGTTTATTITISWTSVGSEGVSYEIMWERDTSLKCTGFSDMGSTTITDGSTSYDITELEEDSTYSITVTTSNSAGSSAVSNTVTAMTMEAGERQSLLVAMHVLLKCMTIPAAPSHSVALNSVSVSEVTSSSITVQWWTVPCIHRNGLIIGYRIRAMTSGEDDRMETVGYVREATITGLTPSTEYTVSVAAVNSQGTGPYSDGIVLSTNGKLVHYNRVEVF